VKVDLHIHSIFSDGHFTPEKIVDVAVECGLSAISITDHDNIIAYEVANAHIEENYKGTEKNIELIPGVEVNTLLDGKEVHILGYYFDLKSKSLQDLIKYQQHARVEQAVKIIEQLKKRAGIDIDFDQVKALVAQGGSIGRPHIAKAIVNKGGTRTVTDAFNKYICDNSPVYVKRKTVSPYEAVEVIYESGGIPVLAHPCDMESAESLIKDLMSCGLRGIEVYHKKHTPAIIEYYSNMAEELDLTVTGGSDFHAPYSNGIIAIGKTFMPPWILDRLKNEKGRMAIAKA